MAAFAAVLVALALAEGRAPRRPAGVARARRWPTNGALMVLGVALTRGGLPLGTLAAATLAADRGWGVLGAAGLATTPLGLVAAVVALDFAIYGQHLAMHRAPLLWRVHRVHHADPALDASTGVRFHPVETLLSGAFKAGLVLALGASPAAVLAFEVLLSASSLFDHANLRLPGHVDRIVRSVFVTPDMHRVHHSLAPAELDRNFGFALSWWDRLCGTYLAEPAAGRESMAVGLGSIPPDRARHLGAMLIEPFRIEPAGTAAPAGAGTARESAPAADLGRADSLRRS